MPVPLKAKWGFASPRVAIPVPKLVAIRIVATVLSLGSGYAFAACEQETALLCSSGDPRCLADAAKTVAQVTGECSTPQGRSQHAALWQATPAFFDGEPHEHVFWRCVSQLCDAAPQAAN